MLSMHIGLMPRLPRSTLENFRMGIMWLERSGCLSWRKRETTEEGRLINGKRGDELEQAGRYRQWRHGSACGEESFGC
jgi:hypothetical protein